jgi:hypothetical protein
MRKNLFYITIIFYLFSFIFLFLRPDSLQSLRNQFYDSDLLFPFALFLGLFNSGHSDWFFSGIIPYFPDLFFGFIFWLTTRNIHLTLIIYAIWQSILITLSLMFLSKCAFGKNTIIISCVIFFSGLLNILVSNGVVELFYVLSWYKHAGVLFFTFTALGLLIQIINKRSLNKFLPLRNLILICLITIIAVASDALYIVQFIIPAIVVLFFMRIKAFIPTRKIVVIVFLFFIAVAIGSSLYDLPHLWGGERINLSSSYIRFSPNQVLNNWNVFNSMLTGIISRQDWMISIWLYFYLLCFILLIVTLFNISNNNSGHIRKIEFFLLAFFLTELPVIFGVSIFSGSIEPWYIHPIIFIPFIFGWPFIIGFIPGLLKMARRQSSIILGIGLISIAIAFGVINLLPFRFANLADYYPPLVECIDQKIGGLGIKKGIAQYRQARPITLLSKMGITLVQVDPEIHPFRWENNSDWYNDDFYFILVDKPETITSFSIHKETVTDRFGPPQATYSCEQMEILVYNRSSDTEFNRQFNNVIGNSLLPVSSDFDKTYSAISLPSQVGLVEGNVRVAIDGSSKGFLTYGPYVELPIGRYFFQINYKAEQSSQNVVGTWDVSLFVDGKPKTLLNGEIIPNKESISGYFEVNEKNSKVEVRTYYNGSGKLAISKLNIRKIVITQP